MWLPNLLFGATGAWFFRRTAREQPLPLQRFSAVHIEPHVLRTAARLRRRLRRQPEG
jgi:hypothetical protein